MGCAALASYPAAGGAGATSTGIPGSATPEPLAPLLPPLEPGVGHAVVPSLEVAQPGATHGGADCGSTPPGDVGGDVPSQAGGGNGHAGAAGGDAGSAEAIGSTGRPHGGTGTIQRAMPGSSVVGVFSGGTTHRGPGSAQAARLCGTARAPDDGRPAGCGHIGGSGHGGIRIGGDTSVPSDGGVVSDAIGSMQRGRQKDGLAEPGRAFGALSTHGRHSGAPPPSPAGGLSGCGGSIGQA